MRQRMRYRWNLWEVLWRLEEVKLGCEAAEIPFPTLPQYRVWASHSDYLPLHNTVARICGSWARAMSFIGVPSQGKKRWRASELAELEDCYGSMDTEKLAAKLSRSINAVRQRAYEEEIRFTENQGWLTVLETARLLGVTPRLLYEICDNEPKVLRHRHIGGKVFIDMADLRFAKAHLEEAGVREWPSEVLAAFEVAPARRARAL